MGTRQSISSCYCTNNAQIPLQQSAVIELSQNTHMFIIRGKLNFNKQSTFKKLQIAATEYCSSMKIGAQYVAVVMRLLAYAEENVFNAMNTLSSENARTQLINSMCIIDFDMMDSLYQYMVIGNNNNNSNNLIHNRLTTTMNKQLNNLKPLSMSNLTISDRVQLTTKGHSLLTQGKVAILIMCAGPSSRFYFQDKFLYTFEVGNEDTTILAILFEKLRENLKVSNKKQLVDLPIVLIGNETNTQAIEEYLRKNKFFYFNQESIYFSTIPSLPILDKNGKVCMNFEYNYLSRPKGSACYLQQITSPQAINILKQRGIQYVHVVGSENLGQSPGDPVFIGLGAMLKRNVAIKCTRMYDNVERQMFDEICSQNSRVKIIRGSKELLQKNNTSTIHLQQHYIPLHSMLFQLQSLPKLVSKFNTINSQQLPSPYRCYQITQNTYDFKMKKPLIGERCFTFQKDIRDTIMVAERPLVVEMEREEFVPIITINNEWCIEEGVQRYLQLRKQKLQMARSQQPIRNQLKRHINHKNYNNKNNSSHIITE